MLLDDGVEIRDLSAGAMAGATDTLLGAHLQNKSESVENPQDELKLGGRLAGLELVDPLARHASARGKLGLTDAQVPAPAAHRRCQVSYGPGPHKTQRTTV